MTDIKSESLEQTEFVAWFRRHFFLARGVRLLSIPNGGDRSPSVARQMKNEGVFPGVPDLFVPEWNLWIEMKRTAGGKVSAAQEEMMLYLILKCGHHAFVAFGCEDAQKKVLIFCREHGKPIPPALIVNEQSPPPHQFFGS